MDRRRCNAAIWTAGGIGGLLGASAAGGFFDGPALPAFVGVGFVLFIVCCGRALKLCSADDIVFDSTKRAGRYSGGAKASEPPSSVVFDFINSRRRNRSV